MSVSGIIIAKNEENMIADAIDSLSFCDEIIVVDNGSTDRTPEISEKLNCKVYKKTTDDFSELRDYGKELAKSEWILYLDADERISARLKEEIKYRISLNDFIAFRIPRKNFYLGHSEWPKIEYMERLFKKSLLKGWEGKLHESPIVEGKIGVLENSIAHYTHRDLTSMLNKTISWSDLEAQARILANHPKMSWWRFPRVMIPTFFNYYVKQKGFKLGTAGLIESIFQTYSVFITYAKLWEQQEEKLGKKA